MKTKDKSGRKFAPFILPKDHGNAPTRSSLKVSLIPATPSLKSSPDEASTTQTVFTFDLDPTHPQSPCTKCRYTNGYIFQVNAFSEPRIESDLSIETSCLETGERKSCKPDSNIRGVVSIGPTRPMTSWGYPPPPPLCPMRCRSASDVIPIRSLSLRPRLLGVPSQLATSSSDSQLPQAKKFWKNGRNPITSIFASRARLWPLVRSESGRKSSLELPRSRSASSVVGNGSASSSAKGFNDSSTCFASSPQPSLRCWSAGSSSCTDRRYSPMPLLNFDMPFPRSHRGDSIVSVGGKVDTQGIDAVCEHVSFTRSLAFPVETETVLGGRRTKARPDPHVETQMNLNRFAKIITAIILIFVAAMVIGVLYKLLES